MARTSSAAEIEINNISWRPAYRIVPTIFPPIEIFEDVCNSGDLEQVLKIEAITDDVARVMSGNLHLIADADIITGPGSGRILPCFLIPDPSPPGRRFSNSEFGAYYAAKELETAIKETIYHRAKFMAETSQPPQEIDNRVLLSDIEGPMHNIRGRRKTMPQLYDTTNYQASQALAVKLRAQGSWGILYESVRQTGGECIAVWRAPCIKKCREERILVYQWDGKRIAGHFEKRNFKSV